MKFNYFGKTKVVLAIAMILITLVYVVSMTGTFFTYEKFTPTLDADGYPSVDDNGEIIGKEEVVEVSQLSYIWFPSGKDYKEYIESDFVDYNINEVAPVMVLLFVLGIAVLVLAIVSLFTNKKIIWTVFATIWGVLAVYNFLTNPTMKLASGIECLQASTGLVTTQIILSCIGCVVGVGALIISVYARKKNRDMLMASILKRD